MLNLHILLHSLLYRGTTSLWGMTCLLHLLSLNSYVGCRVLSVVLSCDTAPLFFVGVLATLVQSVVQIIILLKVPGHWPAMLPPPFLDMVRLVRSRLRTMRHISGQSCSSRDWGCKTTEQHRPRLGWQALSARVCNIDASMLLISSRV